MDKPKITHLKFSDGNKEFFDYLWAHDKESRITGVGGFWKHREFRACISVDADDLASLLSQLDDIRAMIESNASCGWCSAYPNGESSVMFANWKFPKELMDDKIYVAIDGVPA